MRILTKAEEEIYLMFFKKITTRAQVCLSYSYKHSRKMKSQKQTEFEEEEEKPPTERGFTVPSVINCVSEWKGRGYFDVQGKKIWVPSYWRDKRRKTKAEGLRTGFVLFFDEIILDKIVFTKFEKDYIIRMLDFPFVRIGVCKKQNFIEGIKNFLFDAVAIQLHFQRSNKTKIKVPFWIRNNLSNYLSAEKTAKIFLKIRRSKKIEDITKIVGKVTNDIIKQNKLSKRERKKYADYINFVSYSIYLPPKITNKILMLLGKDSFHLSEVIKQNLMWKDFERELETRAK